MEMKAFFASVRNSFGGLSQDQVDGFETVIGAANHLPLTHVSYLLATAWHETAHTMLPVRETLAKTDDQAVARLERAWKKGQLKWVKTPYWRYDANGKTWLGRGYVQLTHKANYERASRELGIDLVGNPNLAMRRSVAAKVLVAGCSGGWFTGKKLSDYLPGDYRNARRVVNGTDKAALIEGYAVQFEAALRQAGYALGIKAPAHTDPAERPQGAWAALVALLMKMLGK